MKKRKIYNLKNLEKKFRNEWILAEVLEVDEFSEPTQVRLITHSKDRDDIYDKMKKVKKGISVATLYTGSPLKKGYAAAFRL